MLWTPISARQTLILPTSISRHGCSCSATTASQRACRTSTAHRCPKTYIPSSIKRLGLALLLVRNGVRLALRHCLKELALRHPGPPRTGVGTIWRRFSILNLNPNLQTPTTDRANLSAPLPLQGRLVHVRSR